MTEVSVRNSPMRSRNRKIRIIDGNFQSDEPEGPPVQPAPPSSPGPRSNGLAPTPHTNEFRHRSLTTPSHSSQDQSSVTSDNESPQQQRDLLSPPPPLHSPVGWRSSGSSSSSLVDTNMTSLLQQPSSEQSILRDLKRQITQSYKNYRVLERQAGQVPKLRQDIGSLRKEREQLMNELLDQKAVVLQLKQRVSLLHGQNLQLATLAQSGAVGGGSTQVLAIRNTLVATLAQLKQMEDQVQSIPALKNQIRDLEQKNELLKEAQHVIAIPSDLPDGVSALDYKSVSEENTRLREANRELTEEMTVVRKHLDSIANSCNSLHKRMDLFQSSQASTHPLQERIKRLEAEKESLCQEILDLKLHGSTSTADIDTAHLMKEITSLQKDKISLQSKLESRKIESRQQKERLLLKLFEIEALNIKTSKYELEKQTLGVEQVHVLQSDGGTDQSCSAVSSTDDEEATVDISPDAKVQLLRFRQLEVHIQESQALLKAFISDKAELESKVTELSSQLEEKGVIVLQENLDEASDKLQLARERIEMLEDELKTRSGLIGSDSSALKAKVAELQDEVKRLTEVERHSMKKEEQLVQLEDTQKACEKLRSEKQKVEKKAKERRHRLHSVASDLARSAQLVKDYQEQCGSLQTELAAARDELKSVRGDLASARAQLEIKEVELTTTMKQQSGIGGNGFADLQSKYDQLARELKTVQSLLTEQTDKLRGEEQQLEEMKQQLTESSDKEKSLSQENSDLKTQVSEAENSCRKVKEEKEHIMTQLESEQKRVVELKERVSQLQQDDMAAVDSHTAQTVSLQHTIDTLQAEKTSLQQKVELLSNEAPLLAQKMVDLRVAKDERERKIQTLLAEQEASSATVQALEEKLKTAEAYSDDVKCKIELLQSDLEMAEAELDQLREERSQEKDEMNKLKLQVDTMKEKLAKENRDSAEVLSKLAVATDKVNSLEEKEKTHSSVMVEMKQRLHDQESELHRTKTETIPNLQHELAKTVSELNQATADYTSRASHIRDLNSQIELLEEEKRQAQHKATAAERELNARSQSVTSLRRQLSTKDAEFEQLTSAHTEALARSHSFSAKVKKLEHEVHRNQSGENQSEVTTLRSTLQHREQQLVKSQEQLAVQVKEHESMRRKVEELTNQCMGLTATKDNLLRRLDSVEKLEMEYDRLKQKMADGNTAVPKGVKNDITIAKKLQEENAELHQQVSTLSQWNDQHQQQIVQLERQLDEANSELSELYGRENLELENQLLRKELAEVEVEVNRLRRQSYYDRNDEERYEDLKLKLSTQTQVVEMFNEHNKHLQEQVATLMDRVTECGGRLERDKPVSPPPMPTPLISITSETDSKVAADLELENSTLKQRIAKLEEELFSAQDISPKIRRRSSTLLVHSSIRWTPNNEDAFVSVPEEMLLPCSLLSDSFIYKTAVPPNQLEQYQGVIRDGWFSCIGQKSVTAECVASYTTTFQRLSKELLKMIINMQDMRGNTALHHLLANGNMKAVSVLLRCVCCDANITNKAGYTPLMMMAAHRIPCNDHRPVVQKLLSKTDTTIRSKVDNLTALMLAASGGNGEMVPLLLEADADINAQDTDGSTALMFACENSNVDVVQLLLSDPRCDTNLTDNDGKTAHDVAAAYSNPDICSLLKQHSSSRQHNHSSQQSSRRQRKK